MKTNVVYLAIFAKHYLLAMTTLQFASDFFNEKYKQTWEF